MQYIYMCVYIHIRVCDVRYFGRLIQLWAVCASATILWVSTRNLW